MLTQDDVKTVKSELKKRLKVAVEWDGYKHDNAEQAYDIAVEFDHAVSMADLERSLNETLNSIDAPEREPYRQILDEVKTLGNFVGEVATDIAKRADSVGQSVANIPPHYYDAVAKRINQQQKSRFVVTAPGWWLPQIKG